jgi:hypothetical protein
MHHDALCRHRAVPPPPQAQGDATGRCHRPAAHAVGLGRPKLRAQRRAVRSLYWYTCKDGKLEPSNSACSALFFWTGLIERRAHRAHRGPRHPPLLLRILLYFGYFWFPFCLGYLLVPFVCRTREAAGGRAVPAVHELSLGLVLKQPWHTVGTHGLADM